jgi:hypothetical protein
MQHSLAAPLQCQKVPLNIFLSNQRIPKPLSCQWNRATGNLNTLLERNWHLRTRWVCLYTVDREPEIELLSVACVYFIFWDLVLQASQQVVLILSVTGSGQFQGCAHLTGDSQLAKQVQQTSPVIWVVITSVHHSLLSGLSEPTSPLRRPIIYSMYAAARSQFT